MRMDGSVVLLSIRKTHFNLVVTMELMFCGGKLAYCPIDYLLFVFDSLSLISNLPILILIYHTDNSHGSCAPEQSSDTYSDAA